MGSFIRGQLPKPAAENLFERPAPWNHAQ
jgi:hypothetical protein